MQESVQKMSQKIRSLEDIFNDPDAAKILVSKKKKVVSHDPEVENFREVTEWVKSHDGKRPEKTMDLTERKMFSRLKGIKENPERRDKLLQYDELGLLGDAESTDDPVKALKKEKMDFSSLDDILNDDSILFANVEANEAVNNKLFDTKQFEATAQEHKAEQKSNRDVMTNFGQYKAMFKQVQADISAGKRQLIRYNNPEKNLKEHEFYILNGQLIYIEAIGDKEKRETRVNGSDLREDARTHVIYENGTENYPMLRGLSASLYASKSRRSVPGYIVSEPEDAPYTLAPDDYVTGYVYVLKSLSKNPQVLELEKEHPLYKVGFTSGTVEGRIANAENESTYLYAPVEVVEKIKVINLNPEALETAIHHALAQFRLDVDIKAGNGKMIQPREWFVVDLNTIEEVVGKLITQLRVKQLDKK